MSGDPRDPPGAARERTMAVAEMAEIALVIEDEPHGAFCSRRAWLTNPHLIRAAAGETVCRCWKGRVLRIIRYGAHN